MTTQRKSPGTAGGGPGRDGDTRHERNLALRREYLQVEADIVDAETTRDIRAARKLRNRLEAIKNEFWNLNAGLAISTARRFGRHGDPNTEDYNQEGALGLWEAFLKWDPEYGTTFGTFSRLPTKGKVHRAVKRYEYSHLTQDEFAVRAQIVETRERLNRQLEREATHAEIAAALGLSIESVRRTLKRRDTSLDAPVGDGESTVLDTISPDVANRDDVEFRSNQLHLDRMIDDLGELETWIVVQRNNVVHDHPLSLVEIADQVGVGKEIVRRAERRGEARMAHTRFTLLHKRNPTLEELGALVNETDTVKLAELIGRDPDEFRARYGRAVAARDNSLRMQDPHMADVATQSMDRIGEEFFSAHLDLLEELARGFTKTSPSGEKLEYATVSINMWDSLIAWDPASRSKYATFTRAWFKDRFPARNRRIDAEPRPDWVTGEEMWDEVRRSGHHDPGFPEDLLIGPQVLADIVRTRTTP